MIQALTQLSALATDPVKSKIELDSGQPFAHMLALAGEGGEDVSQVQL